MTDRATVRLQLLQPCLKVREAQLQAARVDAVAARLSSDQAAAALSAARDRQESVFATFSLRLSGETGIGADDLRMWRAKAANTLAHAKEKTAELSEANGRLEAHRQKTAYADSVSRQLARAVKAARQDAMRLRDQRLETVFEDLWPHRRESQ